MPQKNTAEALNAAAAAGADAFETDVRLTADGALVCVHDADLRRLCGDTRTVAEIDLETLRRLLPGVMTLQDALAASASLYVLLDVKLTDQAQLSQVMAEVATANAIERTMLGLRGVDLIAAARTARRDIAILAFLDDPDAFAVARRAGADWFRLWQGAVTDERLAGVRATGMRLAVMVGQPRSVPLPEYPPFPVGVTDREGLERLLAIAPDAILLDDPRLAVASVR
ncbi:glycerophosphodiester phosphodiesterase [Sinorhizobium arboris]|uniref:glycerophosphodiester phosphodiesterase n=1 Tax=Sinorhizobium arboris TaxID=76745 RepID=UPI003018279D